MEILAEILERRSIRKFKPGPVEKEKVERILKAGRLAPSAKNRQEWRFVAIQKKSIRERIEEAAFGEEHVGQAPVIIAVCTTNISYRMPNGHLSYPIDLTFAASFMLLQAVSEGLGTCCITTFDEQAVRDILSVPYSMRIVVHLLVGYSDEVAEPSIRKPLKSIISYDHW